MKLTQFLKDNRPALGLLTGEGTVDVSAEAERRGVSAPATALEAVQGGQATRAVLETLARDARCFVPENAPAAPVIRMTFLPAAKLAQTWSAADCCSGVSRNVSFLVTTASMASITPREGENWASWSSRIMAGSPAWIRRPISRSRASIPCRMGIFAQAALGLAAVRMRSAAGEALGAYTKGCTANAGPMSK